MEGRTCLWTVTPGELFYLSSWFASTVSQYANPNLDTSINSEIMDEDGSHSAHNSSSDDDEFQEILNTPDSAAKQAARKQLFRKEWIAGNTDQLEKSHKKDRNTTESEEVTSIADLLAKQDSVIITDPRDYQLELFEKAKKQKHHRRPSNRFWQDHDIDPALAAHA